MKILKKIRDNFLDRFLPMWAKETVFAENRQLRQKVADMEQELREKEAYIAGLMAGVKSQRKITINTAEEKK